MTRRLKWVILSLGSMALLPFSHAQEVPSTSDIAFTHPILKSATKTSPFGIRKDPFRDRMSWHGGIDLGASWESMIYAPARGEVIYAGMKSGYGKMIDLKVSDGWVIRFAHMKDLAVAEGEIIESGAVLGEIGSTGRGAGPHLHLETRYRDKQYNPESIESLILFETDSD
ncbi:MAG: M23 family metallopeptidase [Pseudomonadota bacterium]